MSSWTARLPFRPLFPWFGARARSAQPRAARPAETARRPVVPTELDELRGAAMRRLFPKLYSWCSSRWELARAIQVHAYLAQATNVTDLEQRIRAVENRQHFTAG